MGSAKVSPGSPRDRAYRDAVFSQGIAGVQGDANLWLETPPPPIGVQYFPAYPEGHREARRAAFHRVIRSQDIGQVSQPTQAFLVTPPPPEGRQEFPAAFAEITAKRKASMLAAYLALSQGDPQTWLTTPPPPDGKQEFPARIDRSKALRQFQQAREAQATGIPLALFPIPDGHQSFPDTVRGLNAERRRVAINSQLPADLNNTLLLGTRLYFPSTGTSPINTAYEAGWDDTSTASPATRVIDPTPIASAMASIDPGSILWGADNDKLYYQGITRPLDGDQTIYAQSIRLQIRALNDNVAGLFVTWTARVVSGDGSTVRGTLVALRRDDTQVVNVYQNRTDIPTSSSVAALSGDRIVIELGLGGAPAGFIDPMLRVGDSAASDLPSDDTTTTDLNPYVQFEQPLVFGAETAGPPLPAGEQSFPATYERGAILRGQRQQAIQALSSGDAQTWLTTPPPPDGRQEFPAYIDRSLRLRKYQQAREAENAGTPLASFPIPDGRGYFPDDVRDRNVTRRQVAIRAQDAVSVNLNSTLLFPPADTMLPGVQSFPDYVQDRNKARRYQAINALSSGDPQTWLTTAGIPDGRASIPDAVRGLSRRQVAIRSQDQVSVDLNLTLLEPPVEAIPPGKQEFPADVRNRTLGRRYEAVRALSSGDPQTWLTTAAIPIGKASFPDYVEDRLLGRRLAAVFALSQGNPQLWIDTGVVTVPLTPRGLPRGTTRSEQRGRGSSRSGSMGRGSGHALY